MNDTSVDHVIVGAGSDGCVLANRFSAELKLRAHPSRRRMLVLTDGRN